MEPGRVDLESLGLRSGQAETLLLALRPADPIVGGTRYEIEGEILDTRIEVSRTTSGFALRLGAEAVVAGPCARCLEPARITIRLDAREVEQAGSDDAELTSPYVEDGVLDCAAWLHDAITLSLPEKVLCRPDCAGICEVCGASLNDLPPGSHSHERPPDPRFAKLRELEPDRDRDR
jgi:DUF177 domain-containing protein